MPCASSPKRRTFASGFDAAPIRRATFLHAVGDEPAEMRIEPPGKAVGTVEDVMEKAQHDLRVCVVQLQPHADRYARGVNDPRTVRTGAGKAGQISASMSKSTSSSTGLRSRRSDEVLR